MFKSRLLLVSALFFWCFKSQAYPDFIGYGYTSCVTCHYNSGGSGALNDYGRALFASEIAARTFYPKSMSDEEIAERNTFLGLKSLPWWLRPGLKYRGLYYQQNPGSGSAVSKFITMQADASLAIHFDKKQEKVFVASYGYQPTVTDRDGVTTKQNYISREHYFRYKATKTLYVLAGMMDKLFGIRIVDHTAFSRKNVQIGQNDQTHGVLLHWLKPEWDYGVHLFVGDLFQDADLRQKGVSMMGEYLWSEGSKPGASLMYSQNDYLRLIRGAAHWRLQLSKGASLLSEFGIINDTNVADKTSVTGSYALLETMLPIVRGYNFLSQVEYFNKELKPTSEEQFRWSFGTLFFPHPGYEGRLNIVNSKSFKSTQGKSDAWSVQAQAHLSF